YLAPGARCAAVGLVGCDRALVALGWRGREADARPLRARRRRAVPDALRIPRLRLERARPPRPRAPRRARPAARHRGRGPGRARARHGGRWVAARVRLVSADAREPADA